MKSLCFALLISLIAVALSCSSGSEYCDVLDNTEKIILDYPDSALAMLRCIEINSLQGASQKARASLLFAMALDKNYIDTTDVAVVMPAVDYYGKYGTADEKLKSYYYLGRIQYNASDYNAAAISYTLAERHCPDASDHQAKGLLYRKCPTQHI